jgi:hypothetical protein
MGHDHACLSMSSNGSSDQPRTQARIANHNWCDVQWGPNIVEEPPGTSDITNLCCRLLDAMVSHNCKYDSAAEG